MNVGATPEDDDLLSQVRQLRAEGRSPKAIARALGVRPATVAPLVRAIAAETAATDVWERPVAGCWANQGWNVGLTVDGHRDWPRDAETNNGSAGLACVMVARRRGPHRASVCGYLVDVYCLGVKNAFGPHFVNDSDLSATKARFYSSFAGRPRGIPLELARHLVWGAVDYARGLGFEPHPDFQAASGHLGPWQETSAITFGKDGVPFYMEGPHDDVNSVLSTLRKSVGDDNFHYVAGLRGMVIP